MSAIAVLHWFSSSFIRYLHHICVFSFLHERHCPEVKSYIGVKSVGLELSHEYWTVMCLFFPCDRGCTDLLQVSMKIACWS